MTDATRMMKRYLAPLAALSMAFAIGACEDDEDAPTGPGDEPDVSSVTVNVTTQGTNLDPDGYEVILTADQLDEEPSTAPEPESRDLGINGSVTFEQRLTGDHIVELSGVAANCSVAGTNPRQAKVGVGEPAEITFEVTCTTATGTPGDETP